MNVLESARSMPAILIMLMEQRLESYVAILKINDYGKIFD